jgi:hypothetical protein
MTKIEEMWTALEKYQPYADADGHGESWACMLESRTGGASYRAVVEASVRYSWRAASAANGVYDVVVSTGFICVDEYCQDAILFINDAIRLKEIK